MTNNGKKNEQGYLINRDVNLVKSFLDWLTLKFEKNKLHGEPQLQWEIDKGLTGECEIECDD